MGLTWSNSDLFSTPGFIVSPFICPLPGTWLATQACALSGNWIINSLFADRHSIHLVTPARANMVDSFNHILKYSRHKQNLTAFQLDKFHQLLCNQLHSIQIWIGLWWPVLGQGGNGSSRVYHSGCHYRVSEGLEQGSGEGRMMPLSPLSDLGMLEWAAPYRCPPRGS